MAAEDFSGPSDLQVRLRTLGSLDLRSPDDAQVEAVLRQPKRLALLLYLALNGPVYHRRDRLLAIFWPESDERSARGSLSQALFHLRAGLGRDVILSRGDDEIAVAPDRLWCDAVAFRRAVLERRPDEAMALYQGELLPSFLVDETPEFERWLGEERQRLKHDAVNVCGELADAAAQAGRVKDALHWARRAVALEALNESAQRRLIALLDRAGDRAAALHAYDELCALLREEFDAEPAAETVELVKTIRSRADAQFVDTTHENVRFADSAILGGRFKARRNRLVFALFSLSIIFGALVWSALAVRAPAYRPPADHVAVLYFNDESATRDLGYLAESLTSTLIDQLGQVRQLRVISQNGVRPFRGDTVPLDSIARMLDVGTLVGGSITRSGDHLRVTVEMIDGATGAIMQSKKIDRPLGELFALLDELSTEVSAFLRTTVGQEIKVREWRAETRNVEAWRMLQQAEFARRSAEEKEEAGASAQNWALLEQADSLAARALALDRRFTAALALRSEIAHKRAWLSLGMPTQGAQVQWFDTAYVLASRAIEIDSKNGAAFVMRGSIDYSRWLFRLLPAEQADSVLRSAEADLRTALRLSGGRRPRAESLLSLVLTSQGEFAEARTAAQRALEADAYLSDADQIVQRLFDTSFESGDDSEAGRWCDEVRRRNPGNWPSAYCDLVLLGWSGSANPDPRKALHLLQNFGASDPEPLRAVMRPRIMMLSAAVLARAGNRDSANAMLREARRQAPADVELLQLEAATRMLMKDDARAVELLQDYLRINPAARARVLKGRMFARLHDRLA